MSERSIDQVIGERVRARRLQLGMSQEKLGELCGITFQQIQKYEKGSNRVSSSRLIEIAQHLKTGTEYFMNGLGKPGKSTVTGLPDFMLTSDGIALADALSKVAPDKRKSVIKLLRALIEAF